MQRDFVVTLPWPPRQLNPNVAVHRAQLSRVTKKARKEGFLLMRSAMAKQDPIDPSKIVGKVRISYLFAPPDNRARDDDNFIRCMKPYRDGIAEALGVDDKIFRTCESDFAKASRPAFVTAHIQLETKDE